MRLFSEFETSSPGPHEDDDDDDISVQSENSFGGDISDEPWFEMCSYPRGILASWIPIIFAIAAGEPRVLMMFYFLLKTSFSFLTNRFVCEKCVVL